MWGRKLDSFKDFYRKSFGLEKEIKELSMMLFRLTPYCALWTGSSYVFKVLHIQRRIQFQGTRISLVYLLENRDEFSNLLYVLPIFNQQFSWGLTWKYLESFTPLRTKLELHRSSVASNPFFSFLPFLFYKITNIYYYNNSIPIL